MELELNGTLITKIINLLEISGAKHIINQCSEGQSAAKGHIFLLLTLRTHFLRVEQVFLSSQTFYPRSNCPVGQRILGKCVPQTQ